MLKQWKNICVFTAIFILLLLLMSSPALAESQVCEGFTAGTFNGSPACVKGGNLHLCKNNFPDASFLNVIIDSFGNGQEPFLTQSAVDQVRRIVCSNKGIHSLQGICYFTTLEELDCTTNNLTKLDLSKNTSLTELHCMSNSLYTLTLGSNRLRFVNCMQNRLTTLDLSNAPALRQLFCNSNSLSTLLLNGKQLTTLSVGFNQFTQLDLSGLPRLRKLSCDWNQLTNLDVSQLQSLVSLSCKNNQLKDLILGDVNHITQINCSNNNLRNLDVHNLSDLEILECNFNNLTELDLSRNPKLIRLYCQSNSLASLDLSNAKELIHVNCIANNLAYLDLTHNPKIANVEASSQRLTNIYSCDEYPDRMFNMSSIVGSEYIGNILSVAFQSDTIPTTTASYDPATGTVKLPDGTVNIVYTYSIPVSSSAEHLKPYFTVTCQIACTHKWVYPPCSMLNKCEYCGTRNDYHNVPHTLLPATETEPEICSSCGFKTGHPLSHVWEDATCTRPQKCKYCSAANGEPTGHSWYSTTKNCITTTRCRFCSRSSQKVEPHNWVTYDCHWNHCTGCGRKAQKDKAEHIIEGTTFFTRGYCKYCRYAYEACYLTQYLLPILAVLFIIEYTAAVWYLLDYYRIRKY